MIVTPARAFTGALAGLTAPQIRCLRDRINRVAVQVARTASQSGPITVERAREEVAHAIAQARCARQYGDPPVCGLCPVTYYARKARGWNRIARAVAAGVVLSRRATR